MQSVVAQLQLVQPGFLPAELFYQVTRLTVATAVEIVPLRPVSGTCEVLLTQRPEDDPYWPSLWHNPGTFLRPTDELGSFASAFTRICNGELELEAWPTPVFAGTWFWKGARGSVCSQVHWVDITEVQNFPIGKLFPIHSLPSDLIPGMEPILRMAAEHYLKCK